MKYNLVVFIVSVTMLLFSFAESDAGVRTVIDQLGRKVTLPDTPQRIVSLAPSITEIVFALNQEHRLKGVTQYSDFPADALKLPKVGSYVYLDLERIVVLKPDLCIAVKDGNPENVVKKLELLEIPVYAVDPRNLDTVMDTILEIGGLLNADENAETLVREMRYRITQVKTLAVKAVHRPRVFFQIGISPIVSVGTHTFIHELIVLAGGKNLSEGKVPYPRYSREKIISLLPEIFIITSMARGEIFEQVKAQWQQWPDMPAVKNSRIFLVDSNILDRAAPRLVDGLETLFRLIHPQLAENIP